MIHNVWTWVWIRPQCPQAVSLVLEVLFGVGEKMLDRDNLALDETQFRHIETSFIFLPDYK